MDKSDATGIACMVIGAGLAVATVVLPWEIPEALKHILFWVGTLAFVAGSLWLVNLHLLSSARARIKAGIPAVTMVLLFVLAVSIESYRANSESNVVPVFVRTSIQLQFFGDYRMPVAASSNNVAGWYAFHSPGVQYEYGDANTHAVLGQGGIGPSWVIFIATDKPTQYRQAVVTFSNPEREPPIEVRLTTTRLIVVVANSQIPDGILTIEAAGN